MTPRRFKTANIAPVSKTAFVGIGSNLGDREDNLRRAVELLSAEDGRTTEATKRSTWWILTAFAVGWAVACLFADNGGGGRSGGGEMEGFPGGFGGAPGGGGFAGGRARSTSTSSCTATRPWTSRA